MRQTRTPTKSRAFRMEFNGKIVGIEEKTAKNGNVFNIFKIDDGQSTKKFSTFNPDLMGKGFKTGDNVKVTAQKNEKTGFTDLKNLEKSEAPAQQSAAPQKSQENGSQDLQRQILAELKANNETMRSILMHVQAISESLKNKSQKEE